MSEPPTTAATAAPADPPDLIPTGPAYGRDFPDPFVLWTGSEYHAMATTSGLVQLPHLDGGDFTSWQGPTDLLPVTPPWADALSTWAPAAIHAGGGYILYFTAQVRGTERHCISYAVSRSVDGPFVDEHERPVICPDALGGAIDPSPFVDADGGLWLLWKNDGVTLRRESAIWAQRLDGDGRTLRGSPTKLIATDQTWEYPHVEAPSMARLGGTYWLAYSGNWWNQEAYGIGFARCDSPAGPCVKPFDRAVVTSQPGRYGPGGAEFFVDRFGRTLIAYHAWLGKPGYPGHRALFVAEVRLADGLPAVLGVE